MSRKKASSSPWPALLPDVAGEVLLRLPSYADRMCFGAVCRSWRAASVLQRRSPPHLPCVVFIDGTFGGFPEWDRPFRLPRAAGHHGSCGEWLVFKRHDGLFSLLNPFSMAAVAPLPSLSRVDDHKPVRAMRERAVNEYDVIGLGQRILDEPEPGTLSVRKMVICSSGLVAAVIGGEGQLGKFAVCRPGAASWTVCGQDQWRRIKDMVLHSGKIYAVDHNEDLLAITVVNGDTPAVTRIRRAIKGAPPSFDTRRRLALHYLVHLGNKMLMVRREVCRGRPGRGVAVEERLTVFKADFTSKRWAEVTSLGNGVALFLGRWGSRAIRAPDDHQQDWTDHIFFLDDGASDQGRRLRCCSLSAYGVSSPITYSVLPVTLLDVDHDTLPATWLFPQIN